jgi:hypothetical protein
MSQIYHYQIIYTSTSLQHAYKLGSVAFQWEKVCHISGILVAN